MTAPDPRVDLQLCGLTAETPVMAPGLHGFAYLGDAARPVSLHGAGTTPLDQLANLAGFAASLYRSAVDRAAELVAADEASAAGEADRDRRLAQVQDAATVGGSDG